MFCTDKLPLHLTTAPANTCVEIPIQAVDVSVYTVPTDTLESDGTLTWDHTTMVLVEVQAGGRTGLGYTYSGRAAASVVFDTLQHVVIGRDAMDVAGCWLRMVHAVRNLGLEGVCSMAISAVDTALWDLKAKLLDLSLARLLGRVRDAVPAYGSGGFTSYSTAHLQRQLSDWAAAGLSRVKMKIGTNPAQDADRVRAARSAIGPHVELFVDANGAFGPRQALGVAQQLATQDVVWFEEPVDHHDVAGLRFVRDRAPCGLEVAAGEYGYASASAFDRLLSAVDVLQADVTRCGGITGFCRVDALCQARPSALSSHCAPSLHVHVGCAAPTVRHVEYFHDHVTIERRFFDGVVEPRDGCLAPDASRPGLGLAFKRVDARPYLV